MVEDYHRKSREEMQFMNAYYRKTGRHWLHYFDSSSGIPRNPPLLNMWPAEQVGFVRKISSPELFW